MTLSRRRLLAGIATAGAVAGCLGTPRTGTPGAEGDRPSVGRRRGPVPTAPDGGSIPLARHGTPPTICEESVREDPGIYAVVDPAFDRSWDGYEVSREYGELTVETMVVGLSRDGTTRAYPIPVLWYHEIVNDRVGVPLMVTFCPLCNSGMVAARRVGGQATEFLVTGLLWRAPGLQAAVRAERGDVFGANATAETGVRNRGNLVMVDRATGSYWSQVLATAICGEMAGRELRILPSTLARWGEWRAAHPGTTVLLPPPHSGIARPVGGRSE